MDQFRTPQRQLPHTGTLVNIDQEILPWDIFDIMKAVFGSMYMSYFIIVIINNNVLFLTPKYLYTIIHYYFFNIYIYI